MNRSCNSAVTSRTLTLPSRKKSLVRHNRRQICSFLYTLLQLRDFPARRGATGSGKSTQVPKFLMNLPGCTVGMAEPRVVAAESLARRVAAERHEPLGENVGFATGEEWRLPEQIIDDDKRSIYETLDSLNACV